MANSWDTYYVVFLSALLSLCVPATLAVISYVLFPKRRAKADQGKYKLQDSVPVQTILGQRINIRFLLAANAALILMTLALELLPCVTTLRANNQDGLLRGTVAIVTLAGFAVLGLLYSIRKGDMGWLSSPSVVSQLKSQVQQIKKEKEEIK